MDGFCRMTASSGSKQITAKLQMAMEVEQSPNAQSPDQASWNSPSGSSTPSVQALDELTRDIYRELKSIAQACLGSERPNHTLQATALVNEAYLRMRDQRFLNAQNHALFLAIAARTIRRILVDHARAHNAQKRQGKHPVISLAHSPEPPGMPNSDAPADFDLLELHAAIQSLQQLHQRQASVVEMRFFAGMTEPQIAEVLEVSPRTVQNDWVMARAWLRRRLA